MPGFQFLKNLTGIGSQGQAGAITRYRGDNQTHLDLVAVLASRDLVHLTPANAAIALSAGHWRLTVIIQLFHDATTLAIAGHGGHVSLLLWELTSMQALSFHMAQGRGEDGHPVMGGALYPFEPRMLYQILKGNCVNYDAAVAMGALAHLSPTGTGQDVWFYTRSITNVNGEAMRVRMLHHLTNRLNYRFDLALGLVRSNYYTCLTLADDILNAAGLSYRLSSSGTPYNYSYGFRLWDCSLAAEQLMLHLLPSEAAGPYPATRTRKFIGLGQYGLIWSDVVNHPQDITATWDFTAGAAKFTHNPAVRMHYQY
jgi:hypothetical protein